MSPETLPSQEFNVVEEEKKILEGVEPGLVSVFELISRRPLTEKPG
jgi:hypothetical protein